MPYSKAGRLLDLVDDLAYGTLNFQGRRFLLCTDTGKNRDGNVHWMCRKARDGVCAISVVAAMYRGRRAWDLAVWLEVKLVGTFVGLSIARSEWVRKTGCRREMVEGRVMHCCA